MNNPRVSIVILTCNRKEMIIELLQELHKQSITDYETIVVDNNSSDGTPEVIRTKLPSVKLISLNKNIGCGGRNEGIKKARGAIIITLDDDILFEDNDALQKVLNIFEKHTCNVINFKVLDYYTRKLASFNWYHPRKMEDFQDKEFETDYISEGAVAFRKCLFEKVGYYYTDFFLGHEGIDLAYRIIDNNLTIIYSPDIVVLHKHAKMQRTSWRGSYYDTRNYLWLYIRHYPKRMLIPSIIYRLFTTFIFSAYRGHTYWYFKAYKDAILGIPTRWKERNPLRQTTIRRLNKIRADRPGTISKIQTFIKRSRERDY